MINYKFEIGDKVEVVSSKNIGIVKQRKYEEIDHGNNNKTVYERYYVTYANNITNWFLSDKLIGSDELDNEYGVLSVLINVNLMSEYRNLELVKQLYNERESLQK